MMEKSQRGVKFTNNTYHPFIEERKSLGIEHCSICDDYGVEQYIAEDNVVRTRPCECMKEFYNRKRIKFSGLGTTVADKTFESYKADETWQDGIKRTAMSFVYTPNAWFYIGGAVGCGKTHICTAICGVLLKSKNVQYLSWRGGHIQAIKSSVLDEVRYRELIEPLKNVEVLYIDDLFKNGGGKITDADINLAFSILDFRYINKLTTVISSEYFIDKLMKIDGAISSRIYEMSYGFCSQIIDDDGSKNYRLKKRELIQK